MLFANKYLCFLLTILHLFFAIPGKGQQKIHIPFGSFQKNYSTIIGLGYGIRSDEKIIHVNTIGLHFEVLGRGVMQISTFPPPEIPVDSMSEHVYGVNLSVFGSFTQNLGIDGISLSVFPTDCKQVNGILIAWPSMAKTEKLNGIQIAFLASFSDELNGIQFGIGNFVTNKLVGIQIGGGNESGELDGIQISLYNKVNRMAGLQVSLYNDARGRSGGLQIAFVNRSANHYGIQIGLVNFSRKMKGLQIGLINISGKRIVPFINW